MISFDPPPYRIYLLRHAHSGWAAPGERDFDRPLSETGYAEAEIVANKAADKAYRPDLIISSTAVRCRQTAESLVRAFDEDLDIRFVDELYNGSLETYLEIISVQKQSPSVMLIGHNPVMEEALESLIGPDMMYAAVANGYPTAGLAVIDHRQTASATGKNWALADFLLA